MSHKKFNPEKAERLISRKRYQELKPDILLQKLGTPPGNTILDLGCGNGFFTFPAAVGMGEKGMVIAADQSEQMLGLLGMRNPPDNVQILKVDEVELDVESDSVDAVVGITVYHEFKAPLKNLNEIDRVLKSAGKLMFLDWSPSADKERGPHLNHRLTLEQAVNDVAASGFIVDSQEHYLDDMWLIIAHKKN
ncbi:MAG: methyltransferase domain-containing protein [Candidatus Marinimicrobia bacterium]|nr:methyltransferase domain-containing protein [Candidatus Neomarinimicrobiota bacterium]MCF7851340.1 methyltransferase domain-containing protein [Candidatus Neomarinimicrobiota bacterium]MCF7905066.1 methyltransferase domain-containing protein [Candidatus Neomarinimicrobiota bacterium]